MIRRLLLPVTCTLLLAAAAVLLPASPITAVGRWTNGAAAHFWTPDRMADSMPQAAPPTQDPTSEQDAVINPLAVVGTAEHFSGIPSVGVLFSIGSDMAAHFCTASVVHSPGRDLIMTAAHCEDGSHLGFVPGYRSGAAHQPYGIWAVKQEFPDPHWQADDESASDYDVAFATVARGPHGARLEDVTGANRLARTPGYHNQVTVIGYPHAAENPSDQAVTCTTTTGPLQGRRQLEMVCGGFFTGTSGSPWITGYSPSTRTGTVIGVIGGLDGGGTTDRISYSPVLGDAALALYRTAVGAG